VPYASSSNGHLGPISWYGSHMSDSDPSRVMRHAQTFPHLAYHRLNLFPGHSAGPQEHRRVFRDVQHRGLHAQLSGAGVQHQRYPPAQVFQTLDSAVGAYPVARIVVRKAPALLGQDHARRRHLVGERRGERRQEGDMGVPRPHRLDSAGIIGIDTRGHGHPELLGEEGGQRLRVQLELGRCSLRREADDEHLGRALTLRRRTADAPGEHGEKDAETGQEHVRPLQHRLAPVIAASVYAGVEPKR
jgi:hypothetical protein